MSNETIHFLAVDLGASSGRVILGHWDGKRFSLEELHRFRNGPVRIHAHLHWNVLHIWEQIKQGLSRYAASYSQPLAGIGVDTWGVDFALLDRHGHLLGNPYHYRDSRTEGMVELACDRVGRREIFQRTGIQFMPINTLYQLLSMVEANDPQLEAADSLQLMPDYFHYLLSGEKGAEYTIASTTQMLDARKQTWSTDLLEQLHIPLPLLPPVVAPGTVIGSVERSLLAEIGLPGPVPVVLPGSHDTASAVAAIPGLDSRSAYISSGTWSLMGVETHEPVINERSLALNFTNEGGVGNAIRLLKNVAGLWLLQESRRQWRREGREYDWDELLALAADVEPLRSVIDPDAEEFLAPTNMPEAIRAYCARMHEPVPGSVGQVVRCCLESLALRYRWVLHALEELTGRTLDTIRIVGGGSQNTLLSQWTADACQCTVVTGPVEATALGSVMLQAIGTGHIQEIAAGRAAIAASVEQREYAPSDGSAWDEAFGRFTRLLE